MNEVIKKAIDLSKLYADHIFRSDWDHSMRQCTGIKKFSVELDNESLVQPELDRAIMRAGRRRP